MTQQFMIIIIGVVVALFIGMRIYRWWTRPSSCQGCDGCALKSDLTVAQQRKVAAHRAVNKKADCSSLLRAVIVLVAGVAFSSCVLSPSSNQGVNSWVYKQMQTHYLYYEDLPSSSSLDMSKEPKPFFNALLSSKELRNSNYYFSQIEEKEASTKSAFDVQDWYGMQLKFLLNSGDNMIFAVVEYVQKDTPADRAGLQRGDLFYKIDRSFITRDRLAHFFSGGKRTLTRGYFTRNGTLEPRDEVDLAAAEAIYEHPIQLAKTLEVDGQKVGYMVYVSFSTGPGSFENKEYQREFIAAIQRMKDEGVTDFILDLRFNPGGYVEECAVVSSCFVPSQNLGSLFAYTKTNKKQNQRSDKKFSTDASVIRANLNLSRMVVITSESTASASELLIHGLSPFCDVIQVGATTEGKNIGSYELTDKRYNWTLNPITVQVYNSKNDTDYSNGFTPTDENFYDERPYANLLPLGDVSEVLLRRSLIALGYSQSSFAKSCVNQEKAVTLQPINISRPRFGGAIETVVPISQ